MPRNAEAQGFPGGGRGGGHGGMRPSQGGGEHSNQAATPLTEDPLAGFLGTLHALRMELLVREDQVEHWSSMQDALRAYVDLGRDAGQQLRNSAIDPLLRLNNFADDARARADALQKVRDRTTELVAALDDHQRQVFATRLADALSGGASHAP
ncbi:MAG TPA: hypothetical protein VGO25_07525 [Rhodanobacteraceae bacterium]|jgi:hypothetical protein|nr:hypothetical protein [Rhodanobacteraceae bacterium]